MRRAKVSGGPAKADPDAQARPDLRKRCGDDDVTVSHGISFDIRGSRLDEVDSVVMGVLTESDLYVGDTQLEMEREDGTVE